ncbi:hypothetical protein KRM18_23525, partial [Xanthomonas hortorum pv. gardneri]
MQQALGASGLPAVAARQQSPVATDESAEPLARRQALLDPDDARRPRAARATLGGARASLAR